MRRTVVTLALATATALAGVLSGPSADAATGPTTVTVQGRGFGHGHGMSQYGAQGAATAGLTTRQIMAFYYPGTRWGTATGNVSVLISEDTSSDVVIAARTGLTMKALKSKRTWRLGRAGAKRWKIVPVDRGAGSRLMVLTTTWHTVRTVVGPAQFSAGGAPMRLYYPGGSRTYRGALRSAGGATRDTVNVVTLETYLRGVVPREMPASWQPAAVRAQAVAARTYAAFERTQPLSTRYQICDTSQCQVYGGASAEYPASDAAVKATAQQVLTYGGQPAFTQFSASDGGWTAEGSEPYLVAKQDPYDHYPTWNATVQSTAIEKAFPAVGDFQGFGPITRDGQGAWGGRVVTITLTGLKNGASTSVVVDGDTFRSVLGLRSTLFQPV